MKAKKLLSVALAAVLSASLLVGCGNKGGGSSSGQAKDTIVYSMNTAPEGIFNPLISNINIDKYVTSVVYASLMTVNDKGEQEPYLATESKVSDDMKKITYTLSDKAVWHDGEKVTANDVAYTFKAMADPNYTGGYYGDVQAVKGAEAYHNGEAEDIEGIKVIDDKTIEIEFEKVYAPGVTNLGNVEIIPEHIWSKVDPGEWTKQTELLNNPVGCGPYKLTEYKTGSHVKFEAATDFFGGEVKTPNLVFKAINADTTQAEFKGGNVDIANVESLRKADIDALTSEGLKTVSYDNYMFTYMGFNLRKESLKDAKVRQAIMYAIDRQSILDNIVEGRGSIVNAPLLPSSWAYPEESELEQYKYDVEKAKSLLKEAGWEDIVEGRGSIVNAPLLPSSWAYPEESELEQYKYDVEKAKSLLKEAGWEDKDGDGIVENANGEKLELTIDCQNDHEVRQKTATAIQESLKAAGIAVEIDTMEYSALMNGEKLELTIDCQNDHEVRQKTATAIQESLKAAGIAVEIDTMEYSALMDKAVANHDFDLYMMGNTLSLDPDPKPMWASTAISNEPGVIGYNIVAYNNPETDKLIEEGNATLDQNERKSIYGEFAKILNRDVPEAYLFCQNVERVPETDKLIEEGNATLDQNERKSIYGEFAKILNRDVPEAYLFCQNVERVYNPGLEGYKPSTFNEFYNVHNWVIK